MVAESGPRRLSPDLIAPAGDVLARAFFDDPMFRFITPEERRRKAVLPVLFEVAIRQGCDLGEVYGLGSVDGVAIWVAPNTQAPTPDQALISAGALEEQMQVSERERLALVVEQLESTRQRQAPTAHWYLDVLGVDPRRQGQGIGGRILQPVLRRADQSGVSCYLETFKERNLAFYERHGFEALASDGIPSGPRFWPVLRRPQASEG